MRPSYRAAAGLPAWLCGAAILGGKLFAAGPAEVIAPTVGVPAAAEFVVDRPDDSPDSSTGLTLREAIERAARDPRDNTIRFAPAVFRPGRVSVQLERPLISAPRPQGRGGCDVVDGGECGVAIQAGPRAPALIIVRGGRLTLRKLMLVGGSGQTVLADGGSLELADCAVMRSAGAGVLLQGGGRLRVAGGRVGEHKTHGIELHDACVLDVAGATIGHNGQAGIALLDRSRATVERCVLDANGQWGVVATNAAAAALRDTRIRGTGFAGVDAAEQAQIDLDGSRISDGGRFGILASGGARLSLRRSGLSGNSWRGIELQGEAVADLCETAVEQSGHFGVVLFGRSKAQIVGGAVRRNRGHGLTIRDQAAVDVSDCAFEDNEYSGAAAPDAGDGGRLRVRRCVFRHNGMRPLFRGPMHIDPPVPTVLGIDGDRVTVRAAPHATVDLYVDPAGEAARYLRTVTADDAGEFDLAIDSVPSGEVITAAATAHGHTSEFNVIAGRRDAAILAALLARTGPLSDAGGAIEPSATIQRWRRGTRVVFRFEDRPPRHVEAYMECLIGALRGWLDGAVDVDVRFGSGAPLPNGVTVVPIRYAPARDDRINGTGGTTFTQWDSLGYFDGPIRIFLARPAAGETACPRVAIHEMLHALGLYHARVGLRSRMQGTPAPPAGQVNDFAPAPTFFDVAALQILYGHRLPAPTTLAQLTSAGLMPEATVRTVAVAEPRAAMDATSEFSGPAASRR
jgi:hypothetical protein